MEEPKTKRPIFTPVVLLLLVFSLMGNVYLYSKQLQNDRDRRIQRGLDIIKAGNQTKQHIDSVKAGVGKLLDENSIADRISAKTALEAAFDHASELVRFIDEAQISNGRPFTFTKRNATTFLGQVEQSTLLIGNHEGPLTEAERTYLQQVEAWYTQLKATADSFKQDTSSDAAALVIQVKKEWIETGRKLLSIMNEPENVMFKQE
ncbi:hypothetical protein KZ483_20130 [Paenibacillus sp. sptzw28]|uniref:hypothetical protein n=1 Tax=Paenibacillus sp. sptzw28 TaxID=715179 RepID=UPI001C6ECAC7|nr:hypothetical protein [Paenibacillus sp. sptzw28]QYR20146.1 hypothetical protein KZ483_20130 [Paenibacillus sp. sptzw28]